MRRVCFGTIYPGRVITQWPYGQRFSRGNKEDGKRRGEQIFGESNLSSQKKLVGRNQLQR